MRTKHDELKRHLDELKRLYPEVSLDAWSSVEWRLEEMWDSGRQLGISQTAGNVAAATRRVDQRYLDRAGER